MKRVLLVSAVLLAAGCNDRPVERVATTPVEAASASSSAPAPSPPPAIASAPVVAPATVDPSGAWDVTWDRGLSAKPPLLRGTLVVTREDAGWKARMKLRDTSAQPVARSVLVVGDTLEVAFSMTPSPDEARVRARVVDDRLVGEMQWGELPSSTFTAKRRTLPELQRRSVSHSLPARETAGDGAETKAFALLEQRARFERSDALVVLRDGRIALERYRPGYDGGPIISMSVSKSVTSLAIGALIDEKKLTLDTTMGQLFPEWAAQPEKAVITVRHLLTHTSGLDPARAKFASVTIREHTAKAKLVSAPGARFQYNNAAVDFLAVVFRRAAGVGLDTWLQSHLFAKIDAVSADWMRDPDGTPRAAGELMIRPIDLAKIGQIMLDRGQWRGETLVPPSWVESAISPGQTYDEACGLLWWREGTFATLLTTEVIAGFRDNGVDAATLSAAETLLGRRFETRDAYNAALAAAIGRPGAEPLFAMASKRGIPLAGRVATGSIDGFSARGWLGQYVVVVPSTRTVAVRMRAMMRGDGTPEERDVYGDFPEGVVRAFR